MNDGREPSDESDELDVLDDDSLDNSASSNDSEPGHDIAIEQSPPELPTEDSLSQPPPFPETARSTKAIWITAITACYSETVRHAKHLAIALVAKWRSRSLRKSLMDSRIALSDWMCEHDAGDEALRRQISELADRIKSVKAADGSNKQLDTEMRGLKVRLATGYLENLVEMGVQKGPTWAAKTDPPGRGWGSPGLGK